MLCCSHIFQRVALATVTEECFRNYLLRLANLRACFGCMASRKSSKVLNILLFCVFQDYKEYDATYQHGFTKGKSCLTNSIAFYDGTTGWVDEGRAVDVVYLDLSKAFNTVSQNILLGKLRNCGLDEWSVRWIENWLNG